VKGCSCDLHDFVTILNWTFLYAFMDEVFYGGHEKLNFAIYCVKKVF